MNIKNNLNYIGEGFFSDQQGSLAVSVNDNFLKFRQLSNAINYFQEEVVTAVFDLKTFVENEELQNGKSLEVLCYLEKIARDINSDQLFLVEIKENREDFSVLVSKLEGLREFYQERRKEEEFQLIDLKNRLEKNLIQLEKLIKMMSVNESVLDQIKENLEKSEDYLFSFLQNSEKSFLFFMKAKERIRASKVELKKSYLVAPYKELFEKIYSILVAEEKTDIMNPNELHQKIEKLKEELRSFA